MANGQRNDDNTIEKPRLIQSGKMDITFLSLVIILLTIGLICLFSASYANAATVHNDSYMFIKKQMVFAVIGLVVMFLVSKVNCDFYRKYAWAVYIVAILLLIVVLMPFIEPINGVRRWIPIGPGFQPSEIAKFAVVLLFAHLISANYKNMSRFTFSILFLGILLGAVCVLVVLEPHLSATILIFSIGAVLILIGGVKLRYVFVALGTAAAGLAIVVFSGVVGYAGSRLEYWLNPWASPRGEGFQTIQSLIAIGNGGLLGKGLGNSHQKQLYVPEPQNDFIFSIVCEELGLIGALFIVLLFALLVWRGFVIAMRAPDKFRSLLTIGLTFCVGLQAALNVMVVTNTIPNTGIALPFFSYGGTALVITLAEMGVILSISRSSTVNKL